GLLHHSYELDIRDLRLNGVSVGEIGMEAAIAGDFGVPLLLVTADSAGCAETEAILPGVKTVAVKTSLGETGGQCYPLAVTAQWIREAAHEVAATVQPWHLVPPVTLKVVMHSGAYAEMLRRMYPTELTSDGDLVITGPTVTAVWADYWQHKLQCQCELEKINA
ncbi:MAG TPA: M55 family metallopeptidase, partial [Armatimonadota bacterium]|nr:M55 family metallopeptidase [Armatimonadota bacterium]